MNRIPTLFVLFLAVASGAVAQRGTSSRRAAAVPARLAAAAAARPKEIPGTCTPALVKAAPVARPNAYRGGVPTNNDCAGAILLSVGSTCAPITGSTLGATQSLAAITCNTFVGDADDDVWYRFTATATALTVRVDGSTDFDAVVDVRSGTCNGTTIGCADATVEDGIEQVSLTGLTVGTSYLVRVYDYFLGAPATPDFTICVFGTPPPPPNDQCSSGITQLLAVGGSLTLTGTTAGATTTGDALVGSVLDDGIPKVWHRFTTTTCANVTVSYCGTTPVFDQVYIALTTACPANTFVAGQFDFTTCADGNATVTFPDLPAGSYYLPVGEFGGSTSGPYSIVVSATACGAAAPANDNCASVTPVPLATGASVLFSGTTEGATATDDAVTGSPMDDGIPKVWHAFTLAECADVTISYCGTTPVFDQGYIVWTTCPAQDFFAGSFDFTTCADGNLTVVLPGLLPGTYWLPVGLFGPGTSGPYTINLSAVACTGPPANDDCANATPLTVWPVADCPLNATAGNNVQAGQDGGDPSCDSTTDTYLDMWYAFNSGDNTMITVNFNNISMGDAVVVVTEGCGGTEVSCQIGPMAPYDIMVAPNTDHVVRVYSNTQFGGGGDFGICLSGAINTGVDQWTAPAWTLFPNPTAGSIGLVWPGASARALAELVDATGRMVWSARVVLANGANELLGADARPASGTYMLRVSTDRGTTGQRLVVH